MSLLKYIDRLKRMDDLIHRRATGTPDEFATKLNISKSTLMINLKELKEMGAEIKYNATEQTYYYIRRLPLKF
jgi:predicted DNA-binding transcriptional regulator YafY